MFCPVSFHQLIASSGYTFGDPKLKTIPGTLAPKGNIVLYFTKEIMYHSWPLTRDSNVSPFYCNKTNLRYQIHS
jgi:hypothetical protein